MKLMIVVSTVGLTKKLLRCYVDVQKHFELTSEISKLKLVLIHALFENWTLHPIKIEKLKGCMTTENPDCQLYSLRDL